MPKKGLCLQGGGILGAAQAGMLVALSKKDKAVEMPCDVWKDVAGTSIGSLNGLMIALGMSSKEIYDVWYNIKKSDFVSINWFELRKHLYKRTRMRAWIDNLIASRMGASDVDFKALRKFRGVNLMCVGTVVQTGEPIVFGDEYDNVKVIDAIMMSTAFPVGFEPEVYVDETCNRKRQIIDGGIMMNSPLLPLIVEECDDLTMFALGGVDEDVWIDGSIDALAQVLNFVTVANENMSIAWAEMDKRNLTIYSAPCRGCGTFSWDKIRFCIDEGVRAIERGPVDVGYIVKEHGMASKIAKLL